MAMGELQLEEIAKKNKCVDLNQIREVLRLRRELCEKGVISKRGAGYRLLPPFSQAGSPKSSKRAKH